MVKAGEHGESGRAWWKRMSVVKTGKRNKIKAG
jgi:hypothetical protein